ncbi:tetratricopeptide repeat protein [Pelomonas sp. P7]|uniref:Tetratricopeptide repeat protein n=1 Tax=Pelomonas caseinilytica TaxID=2906763 RepID=A0ABS8XAS2_9BURK|nr:tetratricopeptide repeat protein [Pelomonas sp. P7]
MAYRPAALARAAQARAAWRPAVERAMALHRAGLLDEAEALYGQLLKLLPDEPNLVHFHGVLLYQRHRLDEAVAAVRRSIALDDQVAAWHNNLGNMLLDQRQVEAAAAAYQRCLALEPGHVEVRNNLACLLRMTGRLAEAETLLRGLLMQAPDFADAQAHLALVLAAQGRAAEACEAGARALELAPEVTRNHRLLGLLHAQAGRLDVAEQVYRRWLARSPGDPEALHHLAAVTGQGVPERACDAYVTEVFDRFAASFDAKLAHLQYAAPALCAEALRRRAAGRRRAVLDAGCGTGLCGPLLRPLATELVGLDLSAAMLDRARARGSYDQLVQAELAAWMDTSPGRFDAIVSADTLCYFGPLQAVLTAAHRAMRPGGLLVFTVEALEGDAQACVLRPHGRYAHARGAVEDWLAQVGWHAVEAEGATLRQEAGQPVAGWVFSAARA